MPRGERRLVKGLRREEVASVAGVGLTWYTWLEQGREITVSETALSRISTALKLSETDRRYLFSLAGLSKFPRSELAASLPQELETVIDGYIWPAAALTPTFDLIYANRVARRIYAMDDPVGPFFSNQVWQTLKSPHRRLLLVDFEQEARHFISLFRSISAAHVGERHYDRLVESLSAESEIFREVWARATPEAPVPRSIRLRHVDLGEALVRVVRLPLVHDDVGIAFFLSPENDATAAALTKLRKQIDQGHSSGAKPKI